MTKRKIGIGAIALALSQVSYASTLSEFIEPYKTAWDSKRGNKVFDWENDYFSSSDRYYTNGIRIGEKYIGSDFLEIDGQLLEFKSDAVKNAQFDTAPLTTTKMALLGASPKSNECDVPPRSTYEIYLQLTEYNCGFASGKDVDLYRYNAGWSFGSTMYTPDDIQAEIDEILPTDRPFAGYTYFSYSGSKQYVDDAFTYYELQMGVIGPAALGLVQQSLIHEIIDDDIPSWSGQISNDIALQAIYEHRFATPSFLKIEKNKWENTRYFDAQPYVKAEVGTVFNRVTAGLAMRFSFFDLVDMKGYFDSTGVHPGMTKGLDKEAAYQPKAQSCLFKGYFCKPQEMFIYGKVEGTLVQSNALLEGGVFSNSPVTRDARSSFESTAIGFVMQWEDLKMSLIWRTRSPEIDGLEYDHSFHEWGELQFQWGI